MSEVSSSQKTPQAVIHKQILDAAEDNPEASIEELARIVSGASADLVERVLNEYGDPADSEGESTDTGSLEAATASDGGQTQSIDDFDQRFTELNERIDELENRIESRFETEVNPFNDPDLAAKMVRACIADEKISKDEEIEIIRKLMK